MRNVSACPLVGVCSAEVLDVTAPAEAVARHFLRSPATQELPADWDGGCRPGTRT